MECESCGCSMQKEESSYVNIEGAKLNVCPRCRRLGKLISSNQNNFRSSSLYQQNSGYKQSSSSKSPSLKEEFELVENYGHKIKNARDSAGLTLNDLAKKIFEKESFLDRIEKQKTRPPQNVITKIEKELGIVLLEQVSSQTPNEQIQFSKKQFSSAITLGDILEIEKKKKK